MSTPDTFRDGAREILRQASVALGGRPVTLWEVSGQAGLVPQAASGSSPTRDSDVNELQSTLRSWNVPILQGSRWVGSRTPDGMWVIAPVRSRPPVPPPGGRERRSRERLTLELAGLCFGMMDRRAGGTGEQRPARADSLRELVNLPAVIVHEASNPLTAARLTLQLAMETVASWKDLSANRRLELLQDLREVVEEVERAIEVLRAVQDRARGALARSERFDAVRVVRSCFTLESRLLQDRGVPLTLETALESVYLLGDPNALYELLVNLVRNAADASVGRASGSPVEIRLDQIGQSLHLSVRDHGTGIQPEQLDRIFEPGFTTKEFGTGSGMGLALVDSVAHDMFRGTVSVDSAVGAGTTFTVALPIPVQRISDPARKAPLLPQ